MTLVGDGAGGCFLPGTVIELANGEQKLIEEVLPGDVVTTFLGSDNKKEESTENNQISKNTPLVNAIVQKVITHEVDKYLIINNKLKVTESHIIYVNGEWKEAGVIEIGDRLLNKTGVLEEVTTIEVVEAPKTEVYNLMVGKEHTYLAEGYYVHNEGKGDARDTFLDTAFFGSVPTDAFGKADVSFELPDNLTTWRIMTYAFDNQNLQAGQNSNQITTGLPFFVDLVSNNQYLKDDQPILKMRVFGKELDLTKPIEYEVASETLGLDIAKKQTGTSLEVPLKDLLVGTHAITVKAKQGSYTDALTKTIEIKENYQEKYALKTYRVKKDLTGIEGNESGMTQLIFSDLGKARYYSILSNNLVNHDLRADQITANYYSTELLNKYFEGPVNLGTLELEKFMVKNQEFEKEINYNNGMALLPSGVSDLILSAKIADLAADSGYRNNLKSYFYKELYDEGNDINKKMAALYGLASVGESVLNKIHNFKNAHNLNLEGKIFLGLALEKSGSHEEAQRWYKEKIKSEIKFNEEQAFVEEKAEYEKSRKINYHLAMFLAYLDETADFEKVYKSIKENPIEDDLVVLEDTVIAKSRLEKVYQVNSEFKYQTSKREGEVKFDEQSSFSLILSKEELETLTFSDVFGQIEMVSIYREPVKEEKLEKDTSLKLKRSYLVNNEEVTNFNEEEIIKVKFEPTVSNIEEWESIQIIDQLPSGLKPMTGMGVRFMYGSDDKCNRYWSPDIVNNNVVTLSFYDSLFDECSEYSLHYYARVVSKGEYKAEPAMIQSTGRPERINVIKEQSIVIK
jgi:hypothetical protein